MSPRFPRRPQRLDRLFDSVEPLHFVTFNTYRRMPLLARDEVHEAFQIFCTRARAEFQVTVGRYVLMPDHVHLFVFLPREGVILSRWVQSLRSVLGKRLHTLGAVRPHWQEGFFDHVLRSNESYAQKWEYVKMNPAAMVALRMANSVRAGLCPRSDDWPFQGEIVPIIL